MSVEKAHALEQRVNSLLASGVDSWHTFSSLTYQSSWSDGAQAPAKYRYEAFPFKAVAIAGSLTIPAGFAVGQTIVTLPSGYRPSAGHTQVIIGRNFTAAGNPIVSFTIGSGGNFQYGGATGAVAANDSVVFQGLIYLDL